MNDTRPDDAPETPEDASQAAEGPAAEPEATDVSDARPEPEPEGPAARNEPAEPTSPETRPRGRAAGFLAGLALLIALGAGAGAGFNWWMARQDAAARQDLTDRVTTEARQAARQAAQEAARADDERLADLGDRLSSLESAARDRGSRMDRIADQLGAVQERLSSLATASGGAERVPAIADIEHLLIIAHRELTLADNHRVALAALREAGRRLDVLDDPSLLPVRQALSDDISAVEAAAAGAGDGLALRLGSLADRVQGLPLRASLAPEPTGDAASGPEGETGWQRFKRRLVELGTGLFRVRKMDEPPAPLLAPEESFFLHRNLELDLKAARLAAMAGDQANYEQSLASAREAVSSYFLKEDPAVRTFLSALDELAGKDVEPEWPDLTGTLERLRSLTESSEG